MEQLRLNPSSTPRIPGHIRPQRSPALDPRLPATGHHTQLPGATIQRPAVIARTDKTFMIVVRGRQTTVSADRDKPAYILEDNLHDSCRPPAQTSSTTAELASIQNQPPKATRCGRTVRFPARYT
jgi:hypothetical protein